MKINYSPLRKVLLCVVPFAERRCSGGESSNLKDDIRLEEHGSDVCKKRMALRTELDSLASYLLSSHDRVLSYVTKTPGLQWFTFFLVPEMLVHNCRSGIKLIKSN